MALLDLMRTFLVQRSGAGADIHLNWMVLAAAIAVCRRGQSGGFAVSGAAPLRHRSQSRAQGRRQRRHGRGQQRLRAGFIVTQVALTLVLLVVSGMLIRVVTRYRHADLGFDPAHILAVKHRAVARRATRVTIRWPISISRWKSAWPSARRSRRGSINILPIESCGSNLDIHIAGQPPYPPNQGDAGGVPRLPAADISKYGHPSASRAPALAQP